MPSSPQIQSDQTPPDKKGFSVLKNLLLPLLILSIIFGILEGLARTSAAERLLPLRSYGNYHTQFEIKWQKLEDFARDNGGVDVILLGNSMVNTGIDPEILENQLSISGQPLRIFNFGVEGLTGAPVADLASLLVDTYHPAKFIYFTEMRDYLAGNGDDVAKNFLSDEWLQYRLGQKNFTGWLVDHSFALQRLLPLRNWARADFLDTWLQNMRRFENTHPDGYEPEIQKSDFSGNPPDPNDPEDQKLFVLYGNYTIDPDRLSYLKQIIDLREKGTYVVVTEFPAYPGFYTYFGGEQVHADYLSSIADYTREQGGLFVAPISPDLIPLSGRADDHHLNEVGAKLYSGLLGQQFNLLCQLQGICLEGK
jgi:hypothetical protein